MAFERIKKETNLEILSIACQTLPFRQPDKNCSAMLRKATLNGLGCGCLAMNGPRLLVGDFKNCSNLWWIPFKMALNTSMHITISVKTMMFVNKTNINVLCLTVCVPLSFTCHVGICSLLCSPAVWWTSCWHYFSPFHKGVLTAACLCSLYTKCTAERDPFWARGFLKQAICNCSALSTCPEERGHAQIEWIHILWGPQQRIHSFCRPAVDRITATHKNFFICSTYGN